MSIGTYVNVVQFAHSSNSEALMVLYLRPNGRFLFAGYWAGYERTVVIGEWSQEGSEVRLEGRGTSATCVIGRPGPEWFRRVFAVDTSSDTPLLLASGHLKEWSLLSWPGPLTYVGADTVIDPDGRWLPESLATVDAWIDQY